jgi:hypothetical protein
MNRVLIKRSIRDSWVLLASCCALTAGFVWLRIWVASKIQVDALVNLFSGGMKIFESLLPVPIEDLASPLGRAAFGFEEGPTLILLALWTVTRGSECLAGRVGAGTMEMLLAQPVRRISVMASHTAVTAAGVVAITAAGWLGTAAGLSVSSFEHPPAAHAVWPAAVNFLALGLFLLGASTLASALARTRSQAVAVMIGFYVIELALMILSRISPSANWDARWLEKTTFLSAYEPTLLTIGLARDPAANWPVFWQYNGWLLGLGALALAVATITFCRRDVPAPL